ncbi:MAG: lipopolysaccharide transport periplasmic protein LptA [Succinivibrio sp.]
MQHTILRLKTKISFFTALLPLLSLPAAALDNDTEQPLNVVSTEQIADFNRNKAIFIGNVVATQGSMELHADKAELTRDEKGELKDIKSYGKPTTFKQLQENGKEIRTKSAIIEYYPQKNLLILIGRATIWQGNSHVDGERIIYNTLTKQLKATNENSQDGRVQSTFIPQELRDDDKKNSDDKS